MSKQRDTLEILDTAPPHNLEAEKAVIGSVILNPSMLEDITFLRKNDFHNAMYGVLYARLRTMSQAAIPIDCLAIKAQLRQHGEWRDARAKGGYAATITAADLAECMHGVPVAAHVAYYAQLVADASFRRRIIKAAVILVQRAYDPLISVESLKGAALKLLEKIGTEEAKP